MAKYYLTEQTRGVLAEIIRWWQSRPRGAQPAQLADALDTGEQRELRNRRVGFFAVVTNAGPNGEANYTDDRYWVKRSYIDGTNADTNAQANATTPLTTSFEQGLDPYIFTATNTAENSLDKEEAGLSARRPGTHCVPRGTRVWVTAEADHANSPNIRYFFTHPVGPFPVKVSKDGGADGTQSSAASWTYTVSDLANNQLNTAVALARPRPYGTMTFGSTYGIAFYDGSTLKLWDAGEYPGSGGCS